MNGFLDGIKDILRPIVHEYRRNRFRLAWREAKAKRASLHVGARQIAADLRRLGISSGDVVFLHSSLKSIGYVEGGARTVLQALLDVITPEGTLIVPTYYLPDRSIHYVHQDKEYVFDPRAHSTYLGEIPSTFLRLPGIERSIHPTHSISALGRNAKYVTELHHRAPSTFGSGSPWQRCIELGGKVMGLGVSMGPVTFYHVLEDALEDQFPLAVKLRETYYLKCRDWANNLIEVPFRPFDPQIVRRRIDQPRREDLCRYFWIEFERAGLLSVGRIGEALSWFIEARRFYDHLYVLMKQNITIYSTEEQLRQRPPGSADKVVG